MPFAPRAGVLAAILLASCAPRPLHLRIPADTQETRIVDSGNRVEGSIVVDAPPQHVLVFLLDFERWMLGLTGVSVIEVLPGPDLDTASLRPDGVEVRGVDPQEATLAIRSYYVDSRLLMRVRWDGTRVVYGAITEGPVLARGSFTFWLDALDGGRRTRVRAGLDLGAAGLLALIANSRMYPLQVLRLDFARVIQDLPWRVRDAAVRARLTRR